MFKDSILEDGAMGNTKTPITVAISFLTQGIILGIMILIPLLYGEALPAYRLMAILVAPPPPPPPPPAAAAPKVPIRLRVIQQPQGMFEPKGIPAHAAILVEEPLPPLMTGLVPGVTGEIARNDLNGIVTTVAPQPPPPPVPQQPVSLGGRVAEAKLIAQPKPLYPPLARQARIQGTVHLEAFISKDGAIENLTVVSGHPLLIQAALDAVKLWRYRPTLLNGEPVEVVTTVDVSFTLGN